MFEANYTKENIPAFKGEEFEHCTFTGIDLQNTDLSGSRFIECAFNGCDLSNAKLHRTSFQEVRFINCKMMGLHFDDCNEFLLSFSFEGCMLDFSTYYKRKIKKTVFRNCSLREVDFSEADLSEALLDQCDLIDARFDHTVLEKADFSTSLNYRINPEINKIRKAKFSVIGLAGLMEQWDLEIVN